MTPAAPAPAPAALHALCATAARALARPVRVTLHDVRGRVTWTADADPAGGAASTLDEAAAHGVPFGGALAQGTLHVGGAPCDDAARALADSFAALAGATLADDEAARLRARLAEQARHADEMQALASLGSFEWHVAEDRLEWSAEQLRIHGLDARTHPRTFDDFLACVHPDDRAVVAAQSEQMLRDGRAEATYRVVRPDGETRTLFARSEVVRGADGRPARVVGTSLDVTPLHAVERELRAANERLEQRVAERTTALQRSEEHFRRMIEHAHDLIVIMDDTGVTRYGSPSVRHILGYAPEEYQDTSLVSFFHPDDAPRVVEWLGGLAARPGETHRIEFRFRHAAGHWVDLEAVCATSADYRPGTGHVINVRDVTERRRAEEEVRRSEEYFRTLIENAQDMVVVLDPVQARHLYQSPSVQRVLGYAPEELAAMNAFAPIHPDDLPHAMAELAHAMAHPGTTRHAEYRYRHKDGSWRHLETFGRTLSPTSAEQGLVFNTRDVTERTRAEEALARSEEHFRRLIENGSDLLIISDVAGPLTYVSPSAERLLGYTPAEMLGAVPVDFVHPDDVPTIHAVLQAAGAEPGSIRHVDFRMRHRDGSWRRFQSLARTLVPDSAAAGVVCNARDVTEQRLAEEALQRSEEHFRALIEHSYDLVQVIDAQGHIAYTGPSVQRLLGYTPDEIAGMTIPDFMHPDDLPAAGALVARILSNPGTSGSLEYRVRHKDGSWRWLEAWARTLSPTSAEQGLVANARDVTDRKASERALQESEEHFRRMIENGSDLLLISRVDGRLTYASPSVERILGWTPEEAIASRPDDLLHPDDHAHVMASMQRAAAAPGEIHHVDFRVRHRAGGWRRFEALARALAADRPEAGIVCNARDVTEQRAAEAALQRSEEHFRRLIENGSDLLLISAPDGTLSYVSPSAERLLGWHPTELLGKSPADVVHPDDLETLWSGMQRILGEPGAVRSVSWRIRHRDGTWRTIEAIGRTLAADSAAEGVVANGRDVTEQRAAEAALRQAKAEAETAREEAERANRAKSEFLSRMSHELRTPLNSILGFAQVLEDLELPAEYRGGVRHILHGGRHLLNLINEVLDIARIEAAQQPMSIEPVRAEGVIREAIDIVRPLAEQRGIWVAELPHPSAQRFVRADRQRLTQVLLNLLSNAVKYNRPEGAVRIGCEPVRGADGQESLRIRVHDQGAGIDAALRDQLFVPFARLGAEHTGVEGTGLGLALSQRLAQAMGGTLFLERSDAAGSVFAVDLPTTDGPLAALPVVAARADAAAGTHAAATLLYVEDNLANLSLVETILLPRPQWRVLPALQGRLGLELAVQHRPDVILLDLHLPDLPGRDVLRALRADARTAEIPVVVISADATPRTRAALEADGVAAFLTKPLDVRAFLTTVERVLASRPQAGRPRRS